MLSDSEILTELDNNVIIEPFNQSQLSPNSYDVTLGEFYWEPNIDSLPNYLSTENGKQIAQYWGLDNKCTDLYNGSKTYGAKRARQITSEEEAKEFGVNVGDKIIILLPGCLILGHTREIIGGRNNVTTIIKDKSTSGRIGISNCKSAGAGDIGYTEIWTLELENHSLCPIVLRVGQKIGQILFFRTGNVLNSYETKGQYQKTSDLKVIKDSWNPTKMIPSKGLEYVKSIQDIN